MIVYNLKSSEIFCVSFLYRYAENFFCLLEILQNFCGEKLAQAKNRLLITLKKLLQNIDFQLHFSVEKVVENFCEKMVSVRKNDCNFAMSKMTDKKNKILTKKQKKRELLDLLKQLKEKKSVYVDTIYTWSMIEEKDIPTICQNFIDGFLWVC